MTKIECGKDYENASPNDVWNLRDVYDHLFIDNPTREQIYRNHELYGYNKDRFLKLWGKQDFCWVNYISRRFYVWVKELKNCQLIILTHKDKGTCYEYIITGDEKKATEEIIEFLDDIPIKEEE